MKSCFLTLLVLNRAGVDEHTHRVGWKPTRPAVRFWNSLCISALLCTAGTLGTAFKAYADESDRFEPLPSPTTGKSRIVNQVAVLGRPGPPRPMVIRASCESERIDEAGYYLGCRVQSSGETVFFLPSELSEYECINFCEIWDGLDLE